MRYEQANILAQILDDATVQQDGAEWTVKEGDAVHKTIGAGIESLMSQHLDTKAAKEGLLIEPSKELINPADGSSVILPNATEVYGTSKT